MKDVILYKRLRVTYPMNEFVSRIESLFRDGMTWDNHGKVWELDHIKPRHKFDKGTSRDIVNALNNLQPLLIREHLFKSIKDIEGQPYARYFIKLHMQHIRDLDAGIVRTRRQPVYKKKLKKLKIKKQVDTIEMRNVGMSKQLIKYHFNSDGEFNF